MHRERPIINISGGTEIGACLVSVNMLQGIKPTSVGGPALGIGTDIVDGHGNPVRDEVGELAVRGSWPGQDPGLLERPRSLPRHVLGDGWRDLGARRLGVEDEDGFWYLHGRSDDTLNIAGKRIGPAEIESLAVALPEVAMAAAVGVPDEVKGEAIALYLVPATGVRSRRRPDRRVEAAVVAGAWARAFARSRSAGWSDLPRTRSAKIMRRVVKALALGDETGDLSSLENPESLKGIAPLKR